MQDPGRLHLITDIRLQSVFSHLQLFQLAAKAEVPVVQFREKFRTIKRVEEALQMSELSKQCKTRLVINDDPELALVLNAGVHVGNEDPDPSVWIGRLPMVGATVHSLAELNKIRHLALDYIGVGPVFGTSSKQMSLPALGLQSLETIVHQSPFPVIAIGNIQLSNLHSVLETGVYGVAILSAWCHQPDPYRAALEWNEKVSEFYT